MFEHNARMGPGPAEQGAPSLCHWFLGFVKTFHELLHGLINIVRAGLVLEKLHVAFLRTPLFEGVHTTGIVPLSTF